MNYLLDTHIALWAITNPAHLDDSVISVLEDTNNNIYFSATSVWEIAIKHKIHPEQMPIDERSFVTLCESTGFSRLDIKIPHIFEINSLARPKDAPAHHDPFDRLLVAQAKSEGLLFVTRDSLIPYYNEPCIWKV